MLRVRKLKDKSQLKGLYNLMVDQDFPDSPPCFDLALPYLMLAESYGIFKNARLCAGFVLGEVKEQGRFLDVVCAHDFHGKWAMPHIIRKMVAAAFKDDSCNFIWVEAKREASIKAAIKSDFQLLEQGEYPPVFVLSKEKALKKYFKRN